MVSMRRALSEVVIGGTRDADNKHVFNSDWQSFSAPVGSEALFVVCGLDIS